MNQSPERRELHRKKAVEYGTLLGLQESTDTKKPLGYVEESSLYKASVDRHQPSQRKEQCILP